MDPNDNPTTKLVVSRHFATPAELVFDAWLDASALGQWLFATPDGQIQRVECDPRVGGEFTVVERREKHGEKFAADHYGRWVELARPQRLVFDFWTSIEPTPTRVMVDIVPEDNGCWLTLSHDMLPHWAPFQERARVGWAMILDGLSSTLFADREVVSTRLIDAPREQVFAAFSDPDQLVQWWGPNGFTNTIKKFEFRAGGDWHLTMHGPDGMDYHNESVFLTIVLPERIVFDHLRTMHRYLMDSTLFDFDGKTRLIWRQRFESPQEYEKVKAFVLPANEQNFDRLTAHLKGEAIT